VFRDVGQAYQADGKPRGANDGRIRVKKSCQENSKKNAKDGPNDEYGQCIQGDTSLVKTRDLYISETG
jgi:hypothetical protein